MHITQCYRLQICFNTRANPHLLIDIYWLKEPHCDGSSMLSTKYVVLKCRGLTLLTCGMGNVQLTILGSEFVTQTNIANFSKILYDM